MKPARAVASSMAPGAFRAFMRYQANTVTVITAQGTHPAGFTATTLTSVSLRPALVSFCVATASSTRSALSIGGYVGVHILSADQEGLARKFACGGAVKFSGDGWRTGPHRVPVLDGVAAWAVCRIVNTVPAGDHEIVVAAPTCTDLTEGAAEPLVYFRGTYTVVK